MATTPNTTREAVNEATSEAIRATSEASRRTLRQLEKDGLLLSTWETGQTGPARRVYSLTDAGRAWLDAWVATLEVYRSMIDNFFSLYTSLYTGGPSGGEGAAPAEKPDGGDEP